MMLYVRALVLYLLVLRANSGKSSSITLPITGNVYPSGLYTAQIYIGSNMYLVDIDTGSDLSWVWCEDTDYPLNGEVLCSDAACTALRGNANGLQDECKEKKDACEFTAAYADGTTNTGILMRDTFQFTLQNGATVHPQLTFGCAPFPQDVDPTHQHIKGGNLGLGKGVSGIIKQLSKTGVIRNVFGHCLGRQDGGGFIFFGDDSIPSGLIWKQLMPGLTKHPYYLGKADMMFNVGETGDHMRGLDIVFDSGSTYTYLTPLAHGALLRLILKNLRGSPLQLKPYDKTHPLPVCWAGPKPFRFLGEVRTYFKPLALSFRGVQNVKFQVPQENYLIISDQGLVCLGIMNSYANKLGFTNVIGDIFMQDNLVVYDNEHGKVGWSPVISCRK